MKKLLIIIGISVFFLMIASGAAYNSQIIHVDQLYRNMPSSTCYQPTTDKPHEDAVWNLDECYWFVDDPHTPYELQLVLDYCSDSYHYSDDLLVFTNETHYIDNGDCEWEEIGILIEWENNSLKNKFKYMPEVIVAPESKGPSGKPPMPPVLISTNGTGHVTIWSNSFLSVEVMCPTYNPYPGNYQILFDKVPYDTKIHGVKQVSVVREGAEYNGFLFDFENPTNESESAIIQVNCGVTPEPRTEPEPTAN